MFRCLFLLLLICGPLYGDLTQLKTALKRPPPFSYPLEITLRESSTPDAGVLVCLHGFGADRHIADVLRNNPAISDHLVSFNFPDHRLNSGNYNPYTTSFGTIRELLPAMYVLKKCVVDGGIKSISLYGFSAGGGAAVNVIALLTRIDYDADLKGIGVSSEDKQQILQALQQGMIILECPLKSIEELLAIQGDIYQLRVLAERYRMNRLRPIDTLHDWEGLSMNVIVFFQVPDEALSNRDDALFIQNLKNANKKGRTLAVFGKDGGHNAFHPILWKTYQQVNKRETSGAPSH